jgi:proteasome lid subunit RPN8/RPN11
VAVRIAISSVLLEQITANAASSTDEVCGLLFGSDERVDAAVPSINVAADPRHRFEIDPAALIAAHRAARDGGPRPIGHYHSHPSGRAVPSPRDAADAIEDDVLWLIVAAGEVRAWRTAPGGDVEGRFVELGIDKVASPSPLGQKTRSLSKDDR